MENNKISIDNLTVAIPTYNRERYLSKILKSIPAGIKTVVSDNGCYLPKEFIAEFDKVSFIQQAPVVDVIINWNKCIKAVNTEWFMLPSDDDLYFEDSFEIIQHYLLKYNDADLLIFGHTIINKDGNELSKWVPQNEIAYTAPHGYDVFKYGVEARFPGMVFRTSMVNQLENLDESYKLTAADSKLIQQVMLSGKVVFINKIAGAYRTWPQNSTALTSGTIGWLKEIDKWQNEIESFIKTNIKRFSLDGFVKIKDEVYARNLLQSIANIKSASGNRAAFKFMKNIRFPWNAKLSTRLRVIKILLLK